jgi:hypothetical protein
MWDAEVIKRLEKVLDAILFAYGAVPLLVTGIVLAVGVVKGSWEIIHWLKEEVLDHRVRGKMFRLQSTILRAVIAVDETQIFKLRSVRAYERVNSLELDSVPLEGPGATDEDRKAVFPRYYSMPGTIHEILGGKGAAENILKIAFDKSEELTRGRDHAVLLSYAIKGTLDELYSPPFLTARQPVGSDSLVIEAYFPPCRKLKAKSPVAYTINPKTKMKRSIKRLDLKYGNLDLHDGRGPADFI